MNQSGLPLRKAARNAQRTIMRQARHHGLRATTELAKHGLWTPRVTGIVEEFGTVVIEGWITVPPETPPVRVSLSARHLEVAVTWAVPETHRTGTQEIRRFRFLVQDLWDYLRKQDQLVVRANRNVLPIYKVGMFAQPTRNGTKRFGLLAERIRAGWVFSKGGRLQRPKSGDTDWQKDTFAFAEEISGVLAERFGLESFANYGALLGFVRGGGFIDHDNDLDISYISAFDTGTEAAAEFKRIALHLVDAGYWVRCLPTHMSVRKHEGWNRWLDIFHVYFDSEGVLRFPFGIAGRTVLTRAEWRGVRRVEFGAGALTVPVTAQELVEAVYGPNWRQPDPGFAWSRDRTQRAAEGVLSDAGCDEVYWANFWAHAEPAGPSTFHDWVAAHPGLPRAVVDLGCGDGRDACAFATAGRPVAGLDRCRVAVRRAEERVAETAGEVVQGLARFEVCDFGDAAALRKSLAGALERAGGAPVLFYARFLLHVLPAEVQEGLLDAVDAVARPGDAFAAEFRTTADEGRPKAHARHFRRFQDGPAFGAALRERYGFDVLAEQEGEGLAPYGEKEDPVLYRVLARRR